MSYLIVWLKESNRRISILHSDNHFYGNFISLRGCDFVTYKTLAGSKAKARKYARNKDGVIIPVLFSEYDNLYDDWKHDYKSVLARYTLQREYWQKSR